MAALDLYAGRSLHQSTSNALEPGGGAAMHAHSQLAEEGRKRDRRRSPCTGG